MTTTKPRKMIKNLQPGDQYRPNGAYKPLATVDRIEPETRGNFRVYFREGYSRGTNHGSKRVTVL